VWSPKGAAPKALSPRVFPNLRRTHKYWNLPLWKQLSFNFLASFWFHKKEIFPWEHIKLGELPRHNTLGFFCWGRSLKIHIEIKKGLVYVAV
jgi:hypothetical protein